MPQREDDVAPRSGTVEHRTLLQAGGFALAIAATLAVFLTDNPQVLRLAVVGVAWAFVLATLAAGRRSTDRMAARARESQLRRAYEFELEREVAARREYELELETELRRQAEESMRVELDALREDLAGVSGLRDELARVAELRADIGALSALRDEVARVAALRDDVAALTSLRQELGQLAELRADMSRLRTELTEQLSGEMLMERIVMRTQAHRLPAEGPRLDGAGRMLDTAPSWADDVPPRELTGGWPAVRLDEPRQTQQFDQVRVERAPARPPVPPPSPLPSTPPSSNPPSLRPSWESDPTPRPWEAAATATWESLSAPPADTPATASWESAAAGSWSAAPPSAPSPPLVVTPPAVNAQVDDASLWPATADNGPAGQPTRHGGAEPVPEPLPSPLEWLAARSLIDPERTLLRPEVPPRRRRGDEAPEDPAAAATTQRPSVSPHAPIRIDDRGGYRVAVRQDPPADRPGPAAPEKRLADILAENGVSPATGGRRRRRYRDDDESDDVLARVLRTD
jgi:hypothetical protein